MTLPPPKTSFEMIRSTKFQPMPKGRTEGLSIKGAFAQNRDVVNATAAREMLKDFGIKDVAAQKAILEAIVDKSKEGSASLFDKQQLVTAARTFAITLKMAAAGGEDEGEASDEQ